MLRQCSTDLSCALEEGAGQGAGPKRAQNTRGVFESARGAARAPGDASPAAIHTACSDLRSLDPPQTTGWAGEGHTGHKKQHNLITGPPTPHRIDSTSHLSFS